MYIENIYFWGDICEDMSMFTGFKMNVVELILSDESENKLMTAIKHIIKTTVFRALAAIYRYSNRLWKFVTSEECAICLIFLSMNMLRDILKYNRIK